MADASEGATQGAPKKQRRKKTELGVLRDNINGLAKRGAIDQRTLLGRALKEWRREIEADLGGVACISAQQSAIIDILVTQKLMLDSIDGHILKLESLIEIDPKRGMEVVAPVVKDRQAIADSMVRYLVQLGLERRVKSDVASATLVDYLREKHSGGEEEGDNEGVPSGSVVDFGARV